MARLLRGRLIVLLVLLLGLGRSDVLVGVGTKLGVGKERSGKVRLRLLAQLLPFRLLLFLTCRGVFDSSVLSPFIAHNLETCLRV